MRQEDAIALVLDGITAGDDIDRKRPFDTRSSVAVMRAATLGDCSLGRTATRYRSRLVHGATAEATTQNPQLRPGEQHTEIAELIGSLRDLAQVVEVDSRPPVVVPR
jgi:hypothetical protein